MKKVTLAIIAITVAVIVLNLILIFSLYKSSKSRITLFETIYPEFFKFSSELILIVIIGGILIQEYNSRHQRETAYKEFRRDIYKSLVQAYLKTKNIRWLYRADCRNNLMSYQVYKDGLSKIIDVKTQLEVIIHEIEANKKAVKGIETECLANLGMMEDFIRNLYNEYRQESPSIVIENKITVAELPTLSAFIRKSPLKESDGIREDSNMPACSTKEEKSSFSTQYKIYFYNVLDLLQHGKVQQNLEF